MSGSARIAPSNSTIAFSNAPTIIWLTPALFRSFASPEHANVRTANEANNTARVARPIDG